MMRFADLCCIFAFSTVVVIPAMETLNGGQTGVPSKNQTKNPPADPKRTVSPAGAKRATFYVNAIGEAMEELHSGEVRIRENSTVRGKHGRSDYYFAFDVKSGNFRFDTTSTERPQITKYARNPNDVLFYETKADGQLRPVRRHSRDHKVGIDFATPFELRMLPVWSRFQYRGRNPSAEYTRKFYRKIAATRPSAARFGKQFTRLTWILKSDDGNVHVRHFLEFDRNQGNRVVKMEESHRSVKGGKWRLSFRTETKWVKKNETWVPAKWTARTFGLPAVSELTFHWESVNTKIQGKVFQLEGFNLPKGTKIINHKLGKPIQEGVVGEDAPTLASSDPPAWFSRRFTWVMGINAGLFLAIVAVVWWRRRLR